MAGAYTDEELQRLDELGRRREAEALTDIKQRHLSEFTGGRHLRRGSNCTNLSQYTRT